MLYLEVEKLTKKYNKLWNDPNISDDEKQKFVKQYHADIKSLREKQYDPR